MAFFRKSLIEEKVKTRSLKKKFRTDCWFPGFRLCVCHLKAIVLGKSANLSHESPCKMTVSICRLGEDSKEQLSLSAYTQPGRVVRAK